MYNKKQSPLTLGLAPLDLKGVKIAQAQGVPVKFGTRVAAQNVNAGVALASVTATA
jgi:hypothetical protein